MAIIVKLNTSNTGFVVRPSFAAPSNPTTSTIIKNQAMTVSGRLDHLQDVIEGPDPQMGSTLVYNKADDKYEVHRLEFTDVDGPLDGGEF